MARRPDSTLAWFATGLVVLSFPFAARATFDEYAGDDAAFDGALDDAAPGDDAPVEAPKPDDAGSSLDAPGAENASTFTDDSGGISCSVHRTRRGDARTVGVEHAFVLVALAWSMRRGSIAGSRRRTGARAVASKGERSAPNSR